MTYLLKLLDKMCKYEMDLINIVEDTERTDRRMDRRCETSIPLSTSLKRGVEKQTNNQTQISLQLPTSRSHQSAQRPQMPNCAPKYVTKTRKKTTASKTRKTIEHLFYVASSFVNHFIAISEFKLELQSVNTQFGSKSVISCSLWAAGVKNVLSNTNTSTFFFRVSNTNTPAKIWSNTNTNTAHQIQIHTEAETKLSPFYRWHIQIHSIVRKLFHLFKFHWKLFPKVQSTISLAACIGSDNGLALSRQQAIIWPMMTWITDRCINASGIALWSMSV